MTTGPRPGSSRLLRVVTGAYRSGVLPPRGYGQLFDRSPSWLWGGDVVTAGTDVGEMTVSLRDHGARQLLVFGHILHEEGETSLVRRLAPRLRRFYDVGANYGWYSRLVALSAPHVAVTAVEANPILLPFLGSNVLEGTDVLSCALSDAVGTLVFHVSDSSVLGSAHRAVGKPIEVPCQTLDSIAAHSEGVELVKCDVEGGEMAVLRGARALRDSSQPPMWLIEADERFLQEVGASYDELHAELSSGGPVAYYKADADGFVSLLGGGLSDLRGTSDVNVLVVPDARQDLIAGLVR